MVERVRARIQSVGEFHQHAARHPGSGGTASLTIINKLLRQIERGWYQPGILNRLLLPLSWLYCGLAVMHRRYWNGFPRRPAAVGAPVVVVGNLTVGGTGKTPLVIALARELAGRGWRPGIISRGYGGTVGAGPHRVTGEDAAVRVGDEAVLMFRRGGVPLAVGSDRVAAGRLLVESARCDVIISDDGLQHHRLRRDVAVVVIDGSRGLGNGWCLPAGPLRGPSSALKGADITVVNGEDGEADFRMTMAGDRLESVGGGASLPLAALSGRRVHAVAGTGNPDRFFRRLEAAGLLLRRHPFPDHHAYEAADFSFAGADDVVVMTEKDAVKCAGLEIPGQVHYLPVQAALTPEFFGRVETLLGAGGDD